ncbi:MAG: outer membrane protein assembly factor BamA [Azospirillaceae bacterium]|nr:outer membrane protein assembly factor BamA [Azospirillaceae bacterium]
MIKAIQVTGTQRIEESTVRSYLVVKPGDAFDPDRIDQSLKALFATGLFADITMQRSGDVLTVNVVENPIINRIAFEGNHHLEEKDLSKEVQLRARVVYTRTKVQNDVQRLLELYRRSGRFAATVEPKIIQLDQNRVDLVFEINEGSRTGVGRITFVGNHRFDDSRLREELQTKESRWYRFLSSDDSYDPDRLNYDRDLLRRFYLAHGYADFRVISAVAELAPDRSEFYITFTIDEGERYKFGKVGIVSKLKDLDVDKLQELVTTEEGDWYNAKDVEDTIAKLTTGAGDQQFAFVDIKPNIVRHREELTLDVNYEIDEGPRVYVERIDINGNLRTLDKVIRREFQLAEGDPFNASRLARSQQRLKDLNYFDKVDVTTVPGSTPDRTVIQVNVAEKSTGEVSVGAGYSTTDGVLGNFAIREHDFLGRGQNLELSISASQKTQQYNISFSDPYFLDRNLTAGVDLFRIIRNNENTSSYYVRSTGGNLHLGYPLSDHLTQTWTYSMVDTSITNIDTSASVYIQEEEGARLVSSVGQELAYDRRDSKLDPSEGYIVRLSTDAAGAGGSTRYARGRLSAAYYYPVADQWIASLSGEAGGMHGLGQRVHVSDRFFLGGDNFRGFQTGGIGPRDTTTRDALGGRYMAHGTADLAFPLGLPAEFGVTGHAFTDAGTLWSADEVAIAGNPIADDSHIRLSSGVGVGWKSPMGPIRVDLAYPILKQSYDRKELFRFSFGTRF